MISLDQAQARLLDRGGWNARWPTHITAMPRVATGFVIHHGASAAPANLRDQDGDGAPDAEEAVWRGYQSFHMDVREWSDIAYTRGHGQSGWRYEGRGWGRKSGGTGVADAGKLDAGVDIDAYRHSLCCIGNFDAVKPTKELIEALALSIAEAVILGRAVQDWTITYDGQYNSTACPGKYLIAAIPAVGDRAREMLAASEPEPVAPLRVRLARRMVRNADLLVDAKRFAQDDPKGLRLARAAKRSAAISLAHEREL